LRDEMNMLLSRILERDERRAIDDSHKFSLWAFQIHAPLLQLGTLNVQ